MDLLKRFTQDLDSGGCHTPPEARLLLYALCVALRAKRVVELGYDAGYTTEALALSGAHVVGVDNLSEYPNVDAGARERLACYPNVELICQRDALEWLVEQPDASIDLIFVDDNHRPNHVRSEAKEIRRVLRPGGVAVFHDVVIFPVIWDMLVEVFWDWNRIRLPAISPTTGVDCGLGVVMRGDE